MIPLIANPLAFDNQRVTAVGMLFIGRIPESDSIWTNREDGDHALFMDSVHLALEPDQRSSVRCMNFSYVAVTGTFHARGPAMHSLVSGAIDAISEITGWSPFRQDCAGKTNPKVTRP